MRVRELRLARGLSQAQLAEMSGLSVRTIQRIERGANPGLESMRLLAAALDVELAELGAVPAEPPEPHVVRRGRDVLPAPLRGLRRRGRPS